MIDMEGLALSLREKIDTICFGFHYYKIENVLEKAGEFVEELQEFCAFFLQGNIFEIEENEYLDLKNYVLQVLRDYTEALEQQDMVYMLDTLDYGLRELINIYIDEDAGETENE